MAEDDRMAEMMTITDDMCIRAQKAYGSERIMGFSTPLDENRAKWGAPHYIRDFGLPHSPVIWTGDTQDEMLNRCEIEQMRLALAAALIAP